MSYAKLITESKLIELYDESLDDEEIEIEGEEFWPSEILKTLSPKVYARGLDDYADLLGQDYIFVKGRNEEFYEEYRDEQDREILHHDYIDLSENY